LVTQVLQVLLVHRVQ
jgi:hypothetical protein